RAPPAAPLFPYTTLFRSQTGLQWYEIHPTNGAGSWFVPDDFGVHRASPLLGGYRSQADFLHQIHSAYRAVTGSVVGFIPLAMHGDRKSTRLNSSHVKISY